MALVKNTDSSQHSMKYIWYLPQKGKYPLCILFYSPDKLQDGNIPWVAWLLYHIMLSDLII